MKKDTLKMMSLIIFFGALWGTIEATLGYMLQFFPPLVSGFIMFPIAATILIAAYMRSGSVKALFMIGVVAATIKSINLLFPMHYWKTVNPMVAIILETLMVVVVVSIVVQKPFTQKVAGLALASVGWRILYMAYMGMQFLLTGFVHQNLASPVLFAEFVLLQGLLGAGLATLLYYSLKAFLSKTNVRVSTHPAFATMMILIAILTTIFL